MDDQTWKYYRGEAVMWAARRDQALQNSQKAYKRGDGLKAKTESNYGKFCGRKCDESNKLAANAIFIEMNEDRPLSEIDLHGLFLSEAIQKLEDRVIYALNNEMQQLYVIVGQGHHSEGRAKLKPGVMEFAVENGIRYVLNERNPGCILFHFGQSAASRTHKDDYWQSTTTTLSIPITDGYWQSTRTPPISVEHTNTTDYDFYPTRLFWVVFCVLLCIFYLSSTK